MFLKITAFLCVFFEKKGFFSKKLGNNIEHALAFNILSALISKPLSSSNIS